MDETVGYVVWTLMFIIVLILVRVFCTLICQKVAHSSTTNPPRVRRRVVRRIEILPSGLSTVQDRQGNIFTISDEAGGPQNYPDFFVLEPNSQVRSPLDKDDKDLPTYEEVMALSNLTAPTAAAAGSITPTILPNNLPMEVPPYTETDPNPIATTSGGTFTVAIPAANNNSMPSATTTLPEPSTSRNVAAPAATSTVVVTTATGTAANV